MTTEQLFANKRIKVILSRMGKDEGAFSRDPHILLSKTKTPKEDFTAEDILGLLSKGQFSQEEAMFWLGVLAIKNEETAKKHEELATVDELTKIYNRRFFIDSLSRELTRLRTKTMRYLNEGMASFNLSLAMVDIDKFKDINDTYGHQVGDQVLARTAELIGLSLRATDTVFRYGGEEFVVMLPESPKEVAMEVAERIRHKIEISTFPIPEKGVIKKIKKPRRITVSVGVSTIDGLELVKKPVTDTMIPVLIRAADENLYKAKANGRNQVHGGSDEK